MSAAICLFVGYRISLMLMPVLLASVPIGLMVDYYLLHLAAAICIILLSVFFGIRRIANTDNLYYLRSRE